MKKIVLASDSFKGSLSSLDICRFFSSQIKDKNLLTLVPIADGGEGSIDAIASIKKGRFIKCNVHNLYFEEIEVSFFVDEDDNAYIEAASTVGLSLARKDNNPGLVTSMGIGEQILHAINLGIKNIYIFIGGTASNDCGAGIAYALGARFFNKNGESFIPTGLTLKNVYRIEFPYKEELFKNVKINILSDVKSPLYGKDGAAYVFAKQKGAKNDEIPQLDEGLRSFSEVIKNCLNIDVSQIPGSGAAGGIGAGLLAFTSGKIYSGIDTLLDLIHFDDLIQDADLVISGEGKLDRQSFEGKVIDGIAKRCLKAHKNLLLIVGISTLSLEEVSKAYPCVVRIFETNPNHLPFEEIKSNAANDYIEVIKKVSSL